MNRKIAYLAIDLGETDKPASEGNDVAELARHIDAIRAAVDSIPGAAMTDIDLEIVGPSDPQKQVRFNELAL